MPRRRQPRRACITTHAPPEVLATFRARARAEHGVVRAVTGRRGGRDRSAALVLQRLIALYAAGQLGCDCDRCVARARDAHGPAEVGCAA